MCFIISNCPNVSRRRVYVVSGRAKTVYVLRKFFRVSNDDINEFLGILSNWNSNISYLKCGRVFVAPVSKKVYSSLVNLFPLPEVE